MRYKDLCPILIRQLFLYNKDGSLTRLITTNARAKEGTKTFGNFCNGNGYYRIDINKKRYPISYIIFIYHKGYCPDMIDHINGNRGDNRIENLRECDNSENLANARKPSHNSSGVKGLYWDNYHQAWRSQIRFKGKLKSKHSKNKEVVIKWIEETRKELHGNFARN
jgi:hypothetical protein